MPRREGVPPMRRPAANPLFSNTAEPASAPQAPDYQKTSVYLRPDQMELLDTLRAAHRKAGHRTTSASDLMRAALDLAERHREEWDELVTGGGR